MQINAKDKPIKKILLGNKLIVPDFQREYSRSSQELGDFWEDVFLSDELELFIGSFVMIGELDGSEFTIIDGQQRLTTITIALSVIRDIYKKYSFKNLSEGINNYIFYTNDLNEKCPILINQTPYPFFQNYVQKVDKDYSLKNKTGEEKLIKESYDYFAKKIEEKLKGKESDTIKNILNKYRDSLLNIKGVLVSVGNMEDAFTIFETLNSRGKDLEVLDLVKNHIFKNDGTSKEDIDLKKEKRKDLISNINVDKKKFINTFWSSNYKKISEKKLYKNIIDTIKPKNVLSFFSELSDYSIVFKKVSNPQKTDWKKEELDIFYSLSALQTFSVVQTRILVITLILRYEKNKITLKILKKFFTLIENFHFIYNGICGLSPSGFDHMYSKFSLKVKEEEISEIMKIFESLKEQLSKKIPSKEMLNGKIDEKLYYSREESDKKKLVLYFLNKIEKSNNGGNNIVIENYSIEHIFSESSKEKFVKKIGNLVLLEDNINSKIGDKDFETKKEVILKETNFKSTKEVLRKYNKWGEDIINQRKKEITDLIFDKIWKL